MRCCGWIRFASTLFVLFLLSSEVFAQGRDKSELQRLNRDFWSLRKQGKFSEAEAVGKQLLRTAEAGFSDQPGIMADCYYNLGTMFFEVGRYQDAVEMLRLNVASVDASTGSASSGAAWARNNLALAYQGDGSWSEAERLFKHAIALFGKAGEQVAEATAQHNLGNLFRQEGRYVEAEHVQKQAIETRRKKLGEQDYSFAGSLDDLGRLYRLQGRLDESLKLSRQALPIFERLTPNSQPLAICLNNIAHSLRATGNPARGREYHERALAIWQQRFGERNHDVGWTKCYLAMAALEQKDYAAAEQIARECVTTFEAVLPAEHPDQAVPFGILCQAVAQRDLSEARKHADRAVAIRAAAASPGDHAQALALRSSILWAQQERALALADLEKAMQLVELQRRWGSGVDFDRAQFFASFSHVFATAVRRHVELGNLEAAFNAWERGRAKSMLDQMEFDPHDRLAGLNGEQIARFERQQDDVRRQVAEAEREFTALERRSDLTTAARNELHTRLLEQLSDAHRREIEVERDIRNASHVAKFLHSTDRPQVSLADAQQWCTQRKGMIVGYELGPEDSYVFVVQGKNLPLQAIRLELSPAQAKVLAVEPGSFTRTKCQQILMNTTGSGVLQQIVRADDESRWIERLQHLADTLLPPAVRQLVESGEVEQWAIVAEAPLTSLPFEMLVLDRTGPEYLLDRSPPLFYTPSITVLLNLVQRAPKLDRQIDPVLSVGDVAYSELNVDRSQLLAVRSRYLGDGGSFTRLPATAYETQWIAEVFREHGLATTQVTAQQATEGAVRQQIPGRRVVHLACHGVADDRHGNYFGALAFVPGSTDPRDDGFLTLGEIYSLDLSYCELAILSACETNFGPAQHGEGSFALSRDS